MVSSSGIGPTLTIVLITAAALGGTALGFFISNILPSSSTKSENNDNITLKTLLDPNEKYLLPLIQVVELNDETKKFRFGLPSSQHVLGLPIGKHIILTAKINNEEISRPYTPLSNDNDKGYVDLIVKVYYKGENAELSHEGISNYLDNMKIGQMIAFSGPFGEMEYSGNGNFQIDSAKKLNMIASGTGITTMIQLVRYIVENPDDRTICSLLYANNLAEDILLRKDLEQIAANYPSKFKYWYILRNPPLGWTYDREFDEEVIKRHLYPPGDDSIVLISGPPEVFYDSCIPALDNLGYNRIYTY